jgi:flagellar basal body-associated protein FliL
MKLRLLAILFSLMGTAAAGHTMWVSAQALRDLPQFPAARAATSSVAIDEIVVNVLEGERTHSLGLKLDLEVFDEPGKTLIERRTAGVKDAVIQTAREQEYAALGTVPGKLYFKEVLVSRINEALGAAAVREAHIASFYLQ